MRCDNVCEFYGRDGFCFKNNPNKELQNSILGRIA